MPELAGLFLAAFVAATLVPAQSEAVLVTLVVSGAQPIWLLLLVATTGNVLGSIVNWTFGRYLVRFSGRRWFPVSPDRLAQARTWYARWGWWSLFGSWLPIVGDPLTAAAGMMREPFWRFALIVTFAKAIRYIAIAALAQKLA